MSYAHHTHASRRPSMPFFSFAREIGRRFVHRRQINALLKLDDYLLHDIGLSRSDVQRESLRALWRD